MNQLSFKKTFLQGKHLLLISLLTMMQLIQPVFAQTSNCKADFAFQIDHNTKEVKFQARSNRSPVVFGWKISDGTFLRGDQVKHTFSAAGSYKVCLTAIAFDSVTNQRCTTDVCKEVTIVDCDRLEAKFDIEVDGLKVKLRGTSNSQHAVYGYDLGDGTVLRGNPIKHEYAREGIYEICFIAKDTIYGCVTKVCRKVKIENDDCDLEAKFDFRQDGNDFKFFAKSSVDPSRFVWDFGDGEQGYGDETKHSYREAGTYLVCLTVYSQGTNSTRICSTKVCKRVTIEKPNKCELRAEFEFRTDDLKAQFKAKANEDDLHYFWSFGDGEDGTGQEIRHKYKEAGVYEVCLIVFNPKTKCKVCICKKVIITKKCKLKAEIKSRVHLNKAEFKARSNASSDASYSWDFGDGSTASGAHVRHTYAKRGVYEVTLIITDKRADCRIKVSKKVYIGVRPHQIDTRDLEQSIDSETKEIEKPNTDNPVWVANVSPVPAMNKIDVSSKDKTVSSLKIYSLDGTLVLETDKDLSNIDISKLAKGFYYAHVYAADGSITTVKFVKE